MKYKVLIFVICGIFLLGKIHTLREYAEKICYPTLYYSVKGQTDHDWNDRLLKSILPLYDYMSENTPPAAEVEDSFTYEMILALQENDEYTMSEDIETVTQETSPEQLTSTRSVTIVD